LTLTLNK